MFSSLKQHEKVLSGDEKNKIPDRLRRCRKAKLYRFEQENNQWKERGIGQAKFLQNKENKMIRFLMRQEKTLKIRANHLGMHTSVDTPQALVLMQVHCSC